MAEESLADLPRELLELIFRNLDEDHAKALLRALEAPVIDASPWNPTTASDRAMLYRFRHLISYTPDNMTKVIAGDHLESFKYLYACTRTDPAYSYNRMITLVVKNNAMKIFEYLWEPEKEWSVSVPELIIHALRRGHTDIVHRLPQNTNPEGAIPFEEYSDIHQSACKRGHASVVKYLHATHEQYYDSADIFGDLLTASFHGHVGVVACLCEDTTILSECDESARVAICINGLRCDTRIEMFSYTHRVIPLNERGLTKVFKGVAKSGHLDLFRRAAEVYPQHIIDAASTELPHIVGVCSPKYLREVCESIKEELPKDLQWDILHSVISERNPKDALEVLAVLFETVFTRFADIGSILAWDRSPSVCDKLHVEVFKYLDKKLFWLLTHPKNVAIFARSAVSEGNLKLVKYLVMRAPSLRAEDCAPYTPTQQSLECLRYIHNHQ